MQVSMKQLFVVKLTKVVGEKMVVEEEAGRGGGTNHHDDRHPGRHRLRNADVTIATETGHKRRRGGCEQRWRQSGSESRGVVQICGHLGDGQSLLIISPVTRCAATWPLVLELK